LDKIDKKILADLLLDGRKSFADIGATLGVSRNCVRARFEKMKRAGLIVGASVQIDYSSMGYEFATILFQADPLRLERVSNYLKNTLNCCGPYPTSAEHNFCIVLKMRTVSEIETIKERLRRIATVYSLRAGICRRVFYYPNVRLIYDGFWPSRQSLERPDSTSKVLVGLDKLDFDIMAELAKDSRVSFRWLAKKLGSSVETICRRYHMLVSSGLIQPTITLDLAKLGYQCLFLIFIDVAPLCRLDDILATVRRMSGLIGVWIYDGDFQIELCFGIKNAGDILPLCSAVVHFPGVNRTEVMVFPLVLFPVPSI
jgi:Lrp/AsnC family leucine-responsive transcriptional regulator